MKCLKIRCIVNDILCIFKFHIQIYDIHGNLLLDEYSNSLNEVIFNSPCRGLYKIIIKNNLGQIIKCMNIYINNNMSDTICIKLNLFKKSTRKITFRLIDQYYDNLKIERGKLIL